MHGAICRRTRTHMYTHCKSGYPYSLAVPVSISSMYTNTQIQHRKFHSIVLYYKELRNEEREILCLVRSFPSVPDRQPLFIFRLFVRQMCSVN